MALLDNGYIFGEVHDIYNPWSIIKYIHDKGKFLKPYWVNTSDNELIREILQMDKMKSKETLEKLIKGEEVRDILIQNIVYKNIKTEPRTESNREYGLGRPGLVVLPLTKIKITD